MKDGFSVTVKGGKSELIPGLAQVIERLKDMRPKMKDQEARWSDPNSYTDPARFINDDMPKGGKGHGYARHLKKVTGLKRSVKIVFTRPAGPRTAIEEREDMADDVAEWVAESIL
jgi:hypothetical protein